MTPLIEVIKGVEKNYKELERHYDEGLICGVSIVDLETSIQEAQTNIEYLTTLSELSEED